jgi:hypothetical protein
MSNILCGLMLNILGILEQLVFLNLFNQKNLKLRRPLLFSGFFF